MTDKPAKRRWRLNVFDVIIIIVVIAAGFFVLRAARSGGSGIASSGKTVTLHYTIELNSLGFDSASLIKPGDVLVDRVEKHTLGTVESVAVKQYQMSQKNQVTGDYVMSDVPGRETAVIEITSDALETDRDFTVGGGFAVKCGRVVSVTGPGYSGSGFITGIARDGA